MTHDGETANPLQMQKILQMQKVAHMREGIPSAARRVEWLEKAIALLVSHGDDLVDAMSRDFGHRSADQSRLADIAASINTLKFARKNVSAWMRPERRKPTFPLGLLGARARIDYQPKGVVGIISPWNFPVNLTFAPLASVLAAGNRAMIKPSEHTPATSRLLKRLISRAYPEDVVSVITGDADIGMEFSRLAFDHMIFTGSTSIAPHIMRAAADNLVPLTLELGGKSPVIVSRSTDPEKAALRIMAGKTLNAGQVCLAPDYVFVPEETMDAFTRALQTAVIQMFPSGLHDNPDYTAVIHERHHDRLIAFLDDAREKGATILELNPGDDSSSNPSGNKIPPYVILDPTDDMRVMQEEIFGPLLPVKPYGDIHEVIGYINRHPRPLGLYYFGDDRTERDIVLNDTVSGGITINDVVFHCAQEDLPFGGIGPSGMGAYHGRDGFCEFSHKRAVYTQTGNELLSVLRPPYGKAFRKLVARQTRL